jgi:hypothetical protein
MSGLILAPRTNASEIPAVIASSVNLMAFSNTLTEASIVGVGTTRNGASWPLSRLRRGSLAAPRIPGLLDFS